MGRAGPFCRRSCPSRPWCPWVRGRSASSHLSGSSYKDPDRWIQAALAQDGPFKSCHCVTAFKSPLSLPRGDRVCGSPHARPHSVLGGCLSELLRRGTCSHQRGELTVAVEPLDLEWMSVMEACLEGQRAGE